jgi:hypothetical protein
VDALLLRKEHQLQSVNESLSYLQARERELRVARDELARRARLEAKARANAEEWAEESNRKRQRAEARADKMRAEADEAKERLESMPSFYLRDTPVLRWLASQRTARELGIRAPTVLVGSGPWPMKDFRALLAAQGLQTCLLPKPAAGRVIVGREDWAEEALDEHLFDREGRELRIYSFEMMVSFLATGSDPFDADEDVLFSFAHGHPALELLQRKFSWPFTVANSQHSSEWDAEPADTSPLLLMGYHAGKTENLPSSRRLAILTEAYRGELQWSDEHSESYRAGWGRPGSRRRLHRIARHLTMLVRQRRHMRNQHYAVDDWLHDLDGLKRYWRSSMGFQWPSVAVPGRKRRV